MLDPSELSHGVREPWDVLAQALLVALAAALAVTCSSPGTLMPVVPSAHQQAPAPAGSRRLLPELAPSTTSSAPLLPPTAGQPAGPLHRFQEALAALADGARSEPVRILWLGDSHTAADFMTHEVRRRLQRRFGNGGPGFVRVGISPYRHGRVKVDRGGKWQRLPRGPATETPTDDGVFGLGGMRAVPLTPDAYVSVELYAGAVPGETRYDLAFRLPTAASALEVSVDGGEPRRITGGPQVGSIQHLEVKGRADGELRLARFAGAPELFQVVVESVGGGVVLDTVGIDGARVATPLAWDGPSWVAEVERRRPQLVVLSFGTNEVFQKWPVERYAPQYEALVGRIRTAAADMSCLLLGPTDVRDHGGTHPRVVEIDTLQRDTAARLGCGFISLWSLMGGQGAYVRWMSEVPPLARQDGVHLTTAGYERLGELLTQRILEGYQSDGASTGSPGR